MRIQLVGVSLFAVALLPLLGCPKSEPTPPSQIKDGGSSQAGSAGHAGAAGGGAGAAADGGGKSGAGGASAGDASVAGADGGNTGAGCKRGGCSGQLCVDTSAADPITTCEYRAEYGCYQKAACERQAGGTCGHTPSPALSACLAQATADGGVPNGLAWYETCGAPVCKSTPVDDPNVANCKTESAGAACTTKDATCDLVNGCGSKLLCTDQDPTMAVGGCPKSRARFKRDIRYLGSAQRERIYQDLLSIPIASYEYKDDPAATPQLGFIIDDIEPSPAVRGDRVNLYGYLSMAVNAVQLQAKEIDALKQEIAALRAQAEQRAVSCQP